MASKMRMVSDCRKDRPMPTSITLHATPPKQLIHANRLIIASNRGPVEYHISHDKTLKHRRGAGGMVTALIGAASRMEVTWVAMAMTEGDRVALREAQHNNNGLLQSPLRDPKMQLHYVAIPKVAYRKHYEQICNTLLWFLQHYLYDLTDDSTFTRKIKNAWEKGYLIAIHAIADALSSEIQREETTPIVMLHDYHLYLAPAMIRQHHPSIIMQQFIHIPWPDIRRWQFLHSNIAQAIYSGLAGNDIIGFQTERDARNFLEGARTLLDGAVVDFEEGAVWWQGHRTQARAYPISISVTDERRIVQSRAGKRAAERILPLLGEKTIMRVDRIEPTKNIVRGFQAYAQMLDEHPELLRQVRFLAFLVPSRQSLPEYKRYNAEVIKIIEGMNLVAKEGPAVNLTDGLVVLSRTAGAFQQMGKASIPTSPTDIHETAQALYKALTLPSDERRIKAALARQIVERQDLNKWLQRQIADINELLDRLPTRIPMQESMTRMSVVSVG